MRNSLVVLFGLMLTMSGLQAQVEEVGYDSLNAKVQLGALATSDVIPLYLLAQQYGEVDPSDNFFVGGELTYQNRLSKRLNFLTGFSFRNDIISSHYLRLDYDKIFLSLGREKREIGGLGNGLSSGSLAVSNNARPIPMISAGFSDFVNVPFTGGYFKTKGHISHGWLEEDRYIKEALLHAKSFYLMLDLTDEIGWTASSGVIHFAQYGGVSPLGDRLPSSFSDFLRVFAGAGVPNPQNTTEGESNGLGNHLGVIETNVTQQIGNHKLTINYQKPFEDQGGLQYVSLTDYLFGIDWQRPDDGRWINRLYVEYIQTKWQGGPGLPDPFGDIRTEADNFGNAFGGRDNMYNNWLYRSGWTYYDQVIGNPLYLTHERTLEFLEPYSDYSVTVSNNRIRAVSIGLSGNINSKVTYRSIMTYTQNFGTYAGVYDGRFNWGGIVSDPDYDYEFRPALRQFYSIFEFNLNELIREKPISLNLRFSMDAGDMYNAWGAQATLNYALPWN